jgi:hypothetical protein
MEFLKAEQGSGNLTVANLLTPTALERCSISPTRSPFTKRTSHSHRYQQSTSLIAMPSRTTTRVRT